MSAATLETLTHGETWQAYNRAFVDFSKKVQYVQSLTTDPLPDRHAIETALFELERARLAYNTRRDAWVQQLLPTSAHHAPPTVSEDSPQAYKQHVRGIAELLWIIAGRPEGTAVVDWEKAEEIVKRAATAA